MAMVYTGYGVDNARAARVKALNVRRRSISTNHLVKCLSVVLLLAFAGTYLIINAAHSINYKKQLSSSRAYQAQIENRINTVKFEIQRELSYDNLIYNAQTRLGMVHTTGLLTASSTK